MNAPQPKQSRRTAASIREYISRNRPATGRIISAVFEIRSLDEAEKLSTMLANNYPDPERVAAGIWELMSNAIEHGNLGIDYDEKARLLEAGTFVTEIDRRLVTKPWRTRVARVEFHRTGRSIRLRVQDEGDGFDYNRFLDGDMPMDRPNGRGIAIAARFCFDRVTYRGRGNVVDAVINL